MPVVGGAKKKLWKDFISWEKMGESQCKHVVRRCIKREGNGGCTANSGRVHGVQGMVELRVWPDGFKGEKQTTSKSSLTQSDISS